jgi:hypothetical protein
MLDHGKFNTGTRHGIVQQKIKFCFVHYRVVSFGCSRVVGDLGSVAEWVVNLSLYYFPTFIKNDVIVTRQT